MEKICEEKFKRIDEKISICDRRLNSHSDRLDLLEQARAEDKAMIKNLCKEIENLIATLKWIGGPLLIGIVGFFFYALQQGLIK